jgi:hypothetical protein
MAFSRGGGGARWAGIGQSQIPQHPRVPPPRPPTRAPLPPTSASGRALSLPPPPPPPLPLPLGPRPSAAPRDTAPHPFDLLLRCERAASQPSANTPREAQQYRSVTVKNLHTGASRTALYLRAEAFNSAALMRALLPPASLAHHRVRVVGDLSTSSDDLDMFVAALKRTLGPDQSHHSTELPVMSGFAMQPAAIRVLSATLGDDSARTAAAAKLLQDHDTRGDRRHNTDSALNHPDPATAIGFMLRWWYSIYPAATADAIDQFSRDHPIDFTE